MDALALLNSSLAERCASGRLERAGPSKSGAVVGEDSLVEQPIFKCCLLAPPFHGIDRPILTGRRDHHHHTAPQAMHRTPILLRRAAGAARSRPFAATAAGGCSSPSSATAAAAASSSSSSRHPVLLAAAATTTALCAVHIVTQPVGVAAHMSNLARSSAPRVPATADLCDEHEARLQVADPAGAAFRAFGQHVAFGGEIRTVKCFENNPLCVRRGGRGPAVYASRRCLRLG